MKTLILMRHAKAEPATSENEDRLRSLTERGRRDAGIIARTLASRGWKPDCALVSSAARTLETWNEVSPVSNVKAALVVPELYLAPESAFEALIAEHGRAAETLILIGHNPGLHYHVLRLMTQAEAPRGVIEKAQSDFPTAATAVFQFTPEGFEFDALYVPSEMGGGAKS